MPFAYTLQDDALADGFCETETLNFDDDDNDDDVKNDNYILVVMHNSI